MFGFEYGFSNPNPNSKLDKKSGTNVWFIWIIWNIPFDLLIGLRCETKIKSTCVEENNLGMIDSYGLPLSIIKKIRSETVTTCRKLIRRLEINGYNPFSICKDKYLTFSNICCKSCESKVYLDIGWRAINIYLLKIEIEEKHLLKNVANRIEVTFLILIFYLFLINFTQLYQFKIK